ncbi:MAG: TetR/AcrR family transcriptional regulator [Alphaproteobacteria bacterium]
MPYRPDHKENTRVRIVQAARRVMNRSGYSETSIDDVMAEAGLTRGGFYSYFDSKGDLLAAVVREMAERPFPESERAELRRAANRDDAFSVFITRYLSQAHRDRVDQGCSVPPLSPEISRADVTVRKAFDEYATAVTRQVSAMIDPDGKDARQTAMAVLAMCVGGMAISRAVHDSDLSADALAACRAAALRLVDAARHPH